MYEGRVIDAGVDHAWSSQVELMEYMSPGWREYLGRPGLLPHGAGMASINPGNSFRRPGGGDKRAEARPQAGGAAGSDPQIFKAWLDARPAVQSVVLSFDAGALMNALLHPQITVDFARAGNDWTIERWLSADDRFCSLMMICNQLPDESAKEIRRVGSHPGIVGILMGANGLGKSFGHPVYHPIYEAAAELKLPIVIKAGSEVVPDSQTTTTAVGLPATYSEYKAFAAQPVMTHLTGLIGQGVFERFPDLKILVTGVGVLWVAPWLWRYDNNFRGLRRDAPWLKRKPSEYFATNIRVGTNPFDGPASRAAAAKALNAFAMLKDTLCFCSGFPNWDSEEYGEIAELLPDDWIEPVMHANAAATFRLPGRGRPNKAAA